MFVCKKEPSNGFDKNMVIVTKQLCQRRSGRSCVTTYFKT